MIGFERASIGYKGEQVIRDLDLELSGRVLLLGPNGAGKTTLLRGVSGIADIYGGRILVDGVDVSRANGHVGLLSTNLPEITYVLPVDSLSVLELYMEVLGGDTGAALEMLESLGLPEGQLRDKKPWELSAGQLKMLTTVMALASGARNVLLDEPFEQLDPSRKVKMLKKILTTGSETVVLTTHETWLLERLGDWSTYVVFEGRLWGPVRASRLSRAGIAAGSRPDALLVIETSEGPVSILPEGEGVPVTSLISLDRVYEILIGGGAQ